MRFIRALKYFYGAENAFNSITGLVLSFSGIQDILIKHFLFPYILDDGPSSLPDHGHILEYCAEEDQVQEPLWVQQELFQT